MKLTDKIPQGLKRELAEYGQSVMRQIKSKLFIALAIAATPMLIYVIWFGYFSSTSSSPRAVPIGLVYSAIWIVVVVLGYLGSLFFDSFEDFRNDVRNSFRIWPTLPFWQKTAAAGCLVVMAAIVIGMPIRIYFFLFT